MHTLNHKVLDDSVEFRIDVVVLVVGVGVGEEVGHGLGDDLAEETELDGADRFTADTDVEGDLVGDQGFDIGTIGLFVQ